MTTEPNEPQDNSTPEDETLQAEALKPAPEAVDPALEIADLKDKLLRALAEVENIRRRAERDRQDASQYAITGFARELLAVSDNLRRALEHAPASEEQAGEVKLLIEGVELTEKELLRIFEKHGIKKIDPQVGDKFDHNFHQAMFEIPTTEHPKGIILQIMQAGYVIHGRLLRPAMVGIAKPEAGAENGRIDQTV